MRGFIESLLDGLKGVKVSFMDTTAGAEGPSAPTGPRGSVKGPPATPTGPEHTKPCYDSEPEYESDSSSSIEDD